jgi:hypothetical protein
VLETRELAKTAATKFQFRIVVASTDWSTVSHTEWCPNCLSPMLQIAKEPLSSQKTRAEQRRQALGSGPYDDAYHWLIRPADWRCRARAQCGRAAGLPRLRSDTDRVKVLSSARSSAGTV